jgi:hypothetical protein
MSVSLMLSGDLLKMNIITLPVKELIGVHRQNVDYYQAQCNK